MSLPTNQPPQQAQLSPTQRAQALIDLERDLRRIKEGDENHIGVDAAVNRVAAHRVGTDDDERAWNELALQHGRFQGRLCKAVGLDARVPDYEAEAEKEAKNNPAIMAPGRGRFAKGSVWRAVANAAERVALMIALQAWDPKGDNNASNVQGHRGILAIDKDFAGSDEMIAKELDKEAREVLKALLKEAEAMKKIGQDTTAIDAQIQELRRITGLGGQFFGLVHGVHREVDALDKDWARRRHRDFGIGAWGQNRHDEVSPDEMFLFGPIAARFGVHINSIRTMFGMDNSRFRVVSIENRDDESCTLSYDIQVINIPLFSERGIQRCAGMLVASAYANDYRGIPETEEYKDDKGQTRTRFKTDKETGRIIYRPLTPEEKKSIMDKPFGNFTLPGGFVFHSVPFLFDMIVQHQMMGGKPLICGFNPNNRPPFNEKQLEAACDGMNPTTKANFMRAVKEGAVDNYYPAAMKRWEENIRNPKIYEAQQANPIFALERILLKNPKLDPRTATERGDPPKPLTQTDLDNFKKGMVNGQAATLTADQLAEREKMISDMQKKPLNRAIFWGKTKEQELAIEYHMRIPKEKREELEREFTRVSYMDTSGNVEAKASSELEVSGNPNDGGARELSIKDKENDKMCALQIAAEQNAKQLAALKAKQAENPSTTIMMEINDLETERKDIYDQQCMLANGDLAVGAAQDEVMNDFQYVIDHLDPNMTEEQIEIAMNQLRDAYHNEPTAIRDCAARLRDERREGNPRYLGLGDDGFLKLRDMKDLSTTDQKKINDKVERSERAQAQRAQAYRQPSANAQVAANPHIQAAIDDPQYLVDFQYVIDHLDPDMTEKQREIAIAAVNALPPETIRDLATGFRGSWEDNYPRYLRFISDGNIMPLELPVKKRHIIQDRLKVSRAAQADPTATQNTSAARARVGAGSPTTQTKSTTHEPVKRQKL